MICAWSNRKKGARAGAALALLVLAAGCGFSAPLGLASEGTNLPPPPVPGVPTVYTGTAQVRALERGPDDALWAATAGGVVCWKNDAAPPRRWTTADGLPSNDVRALRPLAGGGALVTGAAGACCIGPAGEITPPSDGGYAETSLRVSPPPPDSDAEDIVTARLTTNDGNVLRATTAGVRRLSSAGAKQSWRPILLPAGSRASHISALCSLPGGRVAAALYGDGLYRLTLPRKGKVAAPSWERLPTTPNLPDGCRFVTALAAQPNGTGLVAGTARDGVWDVDTVSGTWTRRALPGALPTADIYALAAFGGALWAATFDQGLLKIAPATGAITPVTQATSDLSGNWTRGLVTFRNMLYVRHTTGQVDRLDANNDGIWRPAFAKNDLPRPQVFALAADGNARLLAGGWAGWASWDGETWQHHWKDPELAGQVITAIAATPDGAIWLGTQKVGLFRFANGVYTHFHEAHGLTDDWITCLAVSPGGGRLLAGTYTGGLLAWDAARERFAPVLRPDGFAIRAVSFQPGTDRAFAATPLGVYAEPNAGAAWQLLDPKASGGLEAQAVLALPGGLWVGTRGGLAWAREPR